MLQVYALFQAALDTCLGSPLLCRPLSSRFALYGVRAFENSPYKPQNQDSQRKLDQPRKNLPGTPKGGGGVKGVCDHEAMKRKR